MKAALLTALAAFPLLYACQQEDVFATWRDPSKYVIQSEISSFTVMQYNIWGADSPWDSGRFDAVAGVINSQHPDFVSLNEVDSLTTRNPWFMCRELAERTGMYYAYAVAIESDEWTRKGTYGDAILSRYPIEEVRRFKLYPDPAQGTVQKENRSVCAIRVDLSGKKVWIVTTHLDHRSNELSRISQAGQLRTVVESLDGSLVLCGDLNARPESRTMSIIFDYMEPQYPSPTSEYYTYPSKYNGQAQPSYMIDYILLKKGEPTLRCASYRVVNATASDHCAVVATFKINEP
ncbi:MAG: endonuclease/exonuclease/phosphatase family protein [Bacteroidales bacterium]|nr:endonuclease/exonuclease/phosphatase family protein [Bacteroidales bacterium]